MNLIGLAGVMNSGKSTVARMLVERNGYVEVACADALKRIAKELWGFSDEALWGPSEKRNDSVEVAHDWVAGRDVVCRRCGVDRGTAVHGDERYLPKCFLTARYALQRLGTECARSIDPDVWIRKALEAAKKILTTSEVCEEFGPDPHDGARFREVSAYYRERGVITARDFDDDPSFPAKGVVISDVRFNNEAAAIVKAGGAVWRIDRIGIEKHLSYGLTHASERLEIDASLIALTIVNDGTLGELAEKVRVALETRR